MKLLYILFITSIVFACNVHDGTQGPKKMQGQKYLALGDSYTIGELVEENERWPMQLVTQLNEENFSIEAPKIIAKTGWRSDELIEAFEIAKLEKEYSLVTIQIGVNNQFQGKSVQQYTEDLNNIIDLAKKISIRSNENILVISIPDYGLTPFGKSLKNKKISEEIKTFNNEARKLCVEKNITFVNITDISKEVESNYDLVAKDKLHPSPKMYRNWLKAISPAVRQILDSK
jgi:lysophospholipase L1-like esterase